MASSIDAETSAGRQLPTRVSNACDRCRRNKSRCDPFRPCSLCVRANAECTLKGLDGPNRALKRKRTQEPSLESSQTRASRQSRGTAQVELELESISRDESRRPSIAECEPDSAMGIAQRIYQLGNQPSVKRTTSAIPGGAIYDKPLSSRLNRNQRRPLTDILNYPLPPMNLMRKMLEEYFESVHWFSLVICEPRFRSKFESIEDDHAYLSQKAFLLLLSTVLGMGAWYKSHKAGVDADLSDEDWRGWSSSLIQGAGAQLTYLMDQTSIASVQTCILLGSYYVYHGKPNLSFALLGATIRTAQAIGLHRQTLRGDPETIEERKRVWWTIYTWDRQVQQAAVGDNLANLSRFASVTYGRPLGINDKDCNVMQPLDTYESPCFIASGVSRKNNSICYSSYQRELNNLYLTASPIIEIVFGMRAIGSSERSAGPQYATKIIEVTESMWAWHRRLPSHLSLALNTDCVLDQSHAARVHQLQALSLQLTFDSLLIIFHRPLLAQQVNHLIRSQPERSQSFTQSPSSLTQGPAASPFFAPSATSPASGSQLSSTEQWWDAALRTSKVTEMPQLAQLATDSHLVAFLAINLFNSAVVMAVLALSDPLSDRAQEVKRTITRIFRLQELLGKKTQLSVQSNVVLKDVIQMVLRREADAMLAPVLLPETSVDGDGEFTTTRSEGPLMSVEDTLRLPIQLPLSSINEYPHGRQHSTADRFLRLNESLASVQRVFPAGFEEIHGDGVMADQEWSDTNDLPNQSNGIATEDWSAATLQGFNIDGDSQWVSDDGSTYGTGNGLYWFWDSIWSDPQS